MVLAGLAVANQALAELCTASARPRAQFPIHYEEAFDALLRHLGSFKAVQLALERRCAAHLALGEIDAAFADAQCALRVSDLLRGEPLLISQLVRFAQNSLAVRAVWQGLAEHRWMDAQLAEFQADFARRDFFSGLALAFEGERAGCILTVDSWIAGRGNVSNLVGPTESGAPAEFPTAFFSRGMLRQNEIALVRYHGRLVGVLRTAITNAATTGLAATAKAASDNAVLSELAGQQSPYRLLAAMLAPATGNSMNKVVRAQTLEKMAMVACALERHHLKHQVFPETLSALVPEFLSAPPLDPMNNQPFHYQRTEDGWFQLYSVGLNGQDDGGVFKFKKSGSSQEELDWPWPVPSRPQQFNLF